MKTLKVVTRRPQFWVNVDLSKFFHDERRVYRIFVDRTKIQRVGQLKRHIRKMFKITKRFYLLANNTEYLPPTENVGILDKRETILLVLCFELCFFRVLFLLHVEILILVALSILSIPVFVLIANRIVESLMI